MNALTTLRYTRLTALIRALAITWLALCTLPNAWSQDYVPPAGAPFFLLTDTSYGSTEESKVRLEIGGRDIDVLQQTGGVDVSVYRLDNALDFLRAQKNLHRVDIRAAARPEGLANTLTFLWDSAWKKARVMWRGIFASNVRKTVTEQAPELQTTDDFLRAPQYQNAPAYKTPQGMVLAARFRYPLQYAQPAAPPKDLKLEGSSSDFIAQSPGNVIIPLGKQKPGLYVVEASIGKHRALALLFVSDTVAVSKTSAQQMLVWVAERAGGKPTEKAQVLWSDLNGVLASGETDSHGVATFKRAVAQTSYVFGQDASGGVFVSENFYFDSEIYNNKLYATTDRPLYRPGDEVHIKLYGREFTGARSSKPMAASSIAITVLDAQGSPVHQDTVGYTPDEGGTSRFMLPENAPAGGYEIRMRRGEDDYSAAFRVAYYVKPHFEILVEPAKPTFKTGEAVTGRIRLAYADGKPVAKAVVSLSARAQVLTMVEGDLTYGGAFALQIKENQELVTDAKGYVNFALPAAKEPSRLVLTVLASDGAAQRVRSTRELLIERSASAYTLKPEQQFAPPNQAIVWRVAQLDGSSDSTPPVKWVALHQESQTKTEGVIAPASLTGGSFNIQLSRPGSYMVQLRDAQDQLVGASPFWVSGGELKPPQGSIDIVFDKPRYKAGDVARALVTFPETVADALLTLERDSVEAYGRLQSSNGLGTVKKINDRQWEVSVKVATEFAPNITFSVAYVYGSEFGFQNAGIAVEQPSISVSIKTDKPSYQPGETVTVDITTTSDGQAVSSMLTIGAVDEMVYVLQPEIAPGIVEFFYHPRRNNVRTHTSLAFISYDEAGIPNGGAPRSRSTLERGIKLLERPRRDERDTAYWIPSLKTNAQGAVRVSFKVPDALTRWRITARAVGLSGSDGLVGERRAYFQSNKPIYSKWTSPNWARNGDRSSISLAVFNQTASNADVQVVLSGAGKPQTQNVGLSPGANFVTFNTDALTASGALKVDILQGGKTVDALETKIDVLNAQWPSRSEQFVSVAAGLNQFNLNLPADARDVQLRAVGEGAALWQPVADALLDYPYGCVEQTASRLIPMALALKALPDTQATANPLRAQLYASRLRLASMAGPDAVFGWWGRGTDSSIFLSSYAYYADYLATQTLGIQLPASHWQRLTDIYSKQHATEPLAHRAVALWMMREMGLPTTTYVRGLVTALQAGSTAAGKAGPGQSWVLGEADAQHAVALVLGAQLAKSESVPWPAELTNPLETARASLASVPQLFPQTLLMLTGASDTANVQEALRKTAESEPTFDRAIALAWLAKTSNLQNRSEVPDVKLDAAWKNIVSATGGKLWLPSAADAALPSNAKLTEPLNQTITFAVRYNSFVRDKTSLAATVSRKLYRLDRDGKGFTKVAVNPADGLSTTALYLDEVTVSSSKTLRYALVEIALPPGALLENSTWGINLTGDKEPQPLERAVGEATRTGYNVPLDKVEGSKTVSHLLRFGQKGTFGLPSARLWRMYQPEGKAYEAGSAVQPWSVQ
jgi:alpha-2-macroglobulin